MGRLVDLLDQDQDGLVSYKELLAFMLQNLDRRRDRLSEVIASLREQLKPLQKSRHGVLKRLAEICDVINTDRTGRLGAMELRKAGDAVGLDISLADSQVLCGALDTIGDGRVPWRTVTGELSIP